MTFEDAQRWMQKLGEHHREERRKFARECGAKTEAEVDRMTECGVPLMSEFDTIRKRCVEVYGLESEAQLSQWEFQCSGCGATPGEWHYDSCVKRDPGLEGVRWSPLVTEIPATMAAVDRFREQMKDICGTPTGKGQKLGFYGEPTPTWEPGMDVRQADVWDVGIDAEGFTFEPVGVRANGDLQFAAVSRELVCFTGETAQRIAFAATRLVTILDTEPSVTMKDAIAQAAEAEGCAREDLCSYLLALGIGSLR